MAITVKETVTKLSVKYMSNSVKGLSAYSLGIEVKDGEDDQKYYDLASAVVPLIDAGDRTQLDPVLTITNIIE